MPLVNVVERMSARNIRATARVSSFTGRRTIKNCLCLPAAARSQRVLNVSTAQVLNSKSIGFTLSRTGDAALTVAVDEGAELRHDVTCFRSARFVQVHCSTCNRGRAPYPSLELQTDRFHVVHGPVRGDAVHMHSGRWTRGRSLIMASHAFVHVQSKTP